MKDLPQWTPAAVYAIVSLLGSLLILAALYITERI